jgi:hypothetical protein
MSSFLKREKQKWTLKQFFFTVVYIFSDILINTLLLWQINNVRQKTRWKDFKNSPVLIYTKYKYQLFVNFLCELFLWIDVKLFDTENTDNSYVMYRFSHFQTLFLSWVWLSNTTTKESIFIL